MRALSCILFVLLVLTAQAHGQQYPERTIQLIAPSAAGAWDDLTTRTVLAKMEALLGQPIIVINKPTAGGRVGLEECAKAKPDGYTLCQANFGQMVAPAPSRPRVPC